MIRPTIQFTRITNSARLPDRFLACQVREFYETGLVGQARLFLLVEISRPWLAASQIGQALIHAFTSGYKDAEGSDDLEQVEQALKRVNETLVHLTQQGETEWVGHLHALFLLEKRGEVHVAHTGRAAAYLLRDDAMSRITDAETAQSATSANHTFGNITSGTLLPGDGLLVGSAEFFRAIPPELAHDSFGDAPAAEVATKYIRLLRHQQLRAAAAIVARVYDATELEDQPLTQDPDVLYLDESPTANFGTTVRQAGRILKRWLLAAGHLLDRTNQHIDHTARTKLAPKAKQVFTSSVATSQQGWNTFVGTTLPKLRKQLGPAVTQATKHLKSGGRALFNSVQAATQQSQERLAVRASWRRARLRRRTCARGQARSLCCSAPWRGPCHWAA